jgi:hypothetical protein
MRVCGAEWRAANPARSAENKARWKKTNAVGLKEYLARVYQSDPEKHKERSRAARLRRSFGISVAEYDRLHLSQAGACALCGNGETSDNGKGTTRRLAVDHCHRTGAVRGLLCQACNTGIGLLKDDPALLLRAIEYLQGHIAKLVHNSTGA